MTWGMTMGDLIDAGMSDGETVRLKVKPNAFLYALEASRFPLLMMFAMLALLFLFALLKGRNPGFGAGAIVYSAIPPLTPHGRGAALPENLRRYQTQTLRAELSAEQLPLLVRFRDINDPMTVERVDPGNLAASFGGGVSLTRASLETTRDPVTTGIDRRLPWLKPLKGGYLDGKFASGNSPLGLDGGDFRRGF